MNFIEYFIYINICCLLFLIHFIINLLVEKYIISLPIIVSITSTIFTMMYMCKCKIVLFFCIENINILIQYSKSLRFIDDDVDEIKLSSTCFMKFLEQIKLCIVFWYVSAIFTLYWIVPNPFPIRKQQKILKW